MCHEIKSYRDCQRKKNEVAIEHIAGVKWLQWVTVSVAAAKQRLHISVGD